jgi:hypothetical protein
MSEMVLNAGQAIRRFDRVVGVMALLVAVLAVAAPAQAVASISFTAESLLGVAPFLLLSIALAAYAKASGADNLIARAFVGREATMVMVAALVGALSPFCSCGVIPLIAALLVMGVPLAPVMAFWLASPIMDPSMFLLTSGTLGVEFAVYKTLAAVVMGLVGGYGTYALMRTGLITEPLRPGIGDGGCGGSAIRQPKPVVWKFWGEAERRARFGRNALDNLIFLGKWLTFAFLLESLMLAYVPGDLIAESIGGDGWFTVLAATLVGVPAYLNGYAALPLVGGLIEQGMAPGAAMAFLLAGGVSSIPAAIAVWALARPPVFAAYLAFAFLGAFAMGALFGLVV